MKVLRIVHGSVPDDPACEDLAVTPVALAALSAAGRSCLQPVDYLSPEEIVEVKWRVTATVEMMAAEWRERGVLPMFLQSVGFDLCVLLETVMVADLVLSAIWNSGRFSGIRLSPYEASHPMLEYSRPYEAYAELLFDEDWCRSRSVRVEIRAATSASTVTTFRRGRSWRGRLGRIRQRVHAARRLAIGHVTVIARKFGLKQLLAPDLIVVPHKDTAELLRSRGAVTIDTYLSSLPHREEDLRELATALERALERWFAGTSPAMQRLGLFKGIIRERMLGFVRTRQDLVAAYVKVRDAQARRPPALLLASSGGCSPDAWVSMALREKGGVIASAQHGGAYGNLNLPYYIFSDFRFDYFFSYGDPELSPTYEFARRRAPAKWIASGSPVLSEVRRKGGSPPAAVTKVLYVMNLSVSFYSANFPWEHILEQFKTLELLDRFSGRYSIHVKEDQTGAVNRARYPGLKFINKRPKEILHEYDLLILESGMSTGVLEGASTNKFLVVFTGSEWEDVSGLSLELLSKRAECFHRWEEFHAGLERILEDPGTHLDPMKLASDEFVQAYCAPVPAEQYVRTIRQALSLS